MFNFLSNFIKIKKFEYKGESILILLQKPLGLGDLVMLSPFVSLIEDKFKSKIFVVSEHKDFIEFKILPYLLGFFALLFLIAAVRGTKRWLYIVFTAFVIFGIVAMADFWKWEYDYGHNLDPNAAIQVPGMAYQPPLK